MSDNNSAWTLPAPADRPDGMEALGFHRGKWTHVKWVAEQGRWHLGYGEPFIADGGRAFAPLPSKPLGEEDTFYAW